MRVLQAQKQNFTPIESLIHPIIKRIADGQDIGEISTLKLKEAKKYLGKLRNIKSLRTLSGLQEREGVEMAVAGIALAGGRITDKE
jgi:hypothetical protein